MVCKKVKHKNFDGATKAVAAVRDKFGSVMNIYYCSSCHCYHLTRKGNKNRLIK